MKAPSTPTIAIVIVAWQDSETIDECLAALERQTITPTEVFLADNGAGLETRLAPWRDRLPITLIDLCTNRGPSAARNAAVTASSAEILMFLDDDAIPEAGWIHAFTAVLENPTIVAARGKVVPRHATILNGLARAYDLGPARRPSIINTEGNCTIRRAVFDRIGGFNEDMFGHEGAELSSRIIAAYGDQAIFYTPHAVIGHDYTSGPVAYLKKRFRHGLMLRQLGMKSTRFAASRSTQRSRWQWRQAILLPVKFMGNSAELAGLAWSLVRVRS